MRDRASERTDVSVSGIGFLAWGRYRLPRFRSSSARVKRTLTT